MGPTIFANHILADFRKSIEHQLIRNAAYADTTKRSSNEEYEIAIAHLLSFARRRPAFVLDEVAKSR